MSGEDFFFPPVPSVPRVTQIRTSVLTPSETFRHPFLDLTRRNRLGPSLRLDLNLISCFCFGVVLTDYGRQTVVQQKQNEDYFK